MHAIYTASNIPSSNFNAYMSHYNHTFQKLYKFTESKCKYALSKLPTGSYSLMEYITPADNDIRQCLDLKTIVESKKNTVQGNLIQLYAKQKDAEANINILENHKTTILKELNAIRTQRATSEHKINDVVILMAKQEIKCKPFAQLLICLFKVLKNEDINEKQVSKKSLESLIMDIKNYQPTSDKKSLEDIIQQVDSISNVLNNDTSISHNNSETKYIYTTFINCIVSLAKEGINQIDDSIADKDISEVYKLHS